MAIQEHADAITFELLAGDTDTRARIRQTLQTLLSLCGRLVPGEDGEKGHRLVLVRPRQ